MIRELETRSRTSVKGNVMKNSKKFVFHIYPENIDYIESLSYQDKTIIINDLLSKYRKNQELELKTEKGFKRFTKVIAVILAIAIGFPLAVILTSQAIKVSQQNNDAMKSYFQNVRIKW